MRTVIITEHSPVTVAVRDILMTMIMVTATLRFAVPVTKMSITAARDATVLFMTMTQTGTVTIPIASHATMISVTILSTNIPTSLTRYSTTARMKRRSDITVWSLKLTRAARMTAMPRCCTTLQILMRKICT